MPRAFGGVEAPFGIRPPLTRCWEPAGGPLFGRGPFDGTRSEAAALGGGASDGRAGGGISPGVPFVLKLEVALGERGAFVAR